MDITRERLANGLAFLCVIAVTGIIATLAYQWVLDPRPLPYGAWLPWLVFSIGPAFGYLMGTLDNSDLE